MFGIPAGLAVAAVVLALRITGSYRHAPDEAHEAPWAQVRAGIRFVVHHPVLRPLVIGGGLMNMASTCYFAVFVLWVVGDGSRLGMEPQHWPLVLAVLAVGAVIGSLVTAPLLRVLPELPVMFGAWLIGGPLLLVPVLVPTIPALVVVAFLLGLTNTMGNVLTQAMRQRIVPARMLGRATGASRTLSYGLMPLGALLGGQLAEHFGLATALVGGAVLGTVAAVYPTLVVRPHLVAAAEAANTDD